MNSQINDLILQLLNFHPQLTEDEFDSIIKQIKEIIYSFNPKDSLKRRADELFYNHLSYYKEQYLRNIDIPYTEDYTHATIINLVNDLEKLKEMAS